MNRSITFARTGSARNRKHDRARARMRMLPVVLTLATVAIRAFAQTSPASTAPPATGQQESPVPRYIGTDAGQWERWDLNAHLNGKAPITPQLASGTTSSGGLNSTGRLSASCIANPAAPTAVQTGIAGTTTLSYFLVCHDSNGGATLPSSATTITNANATLNSSNYVLISWPAVSGCASWDVLKGDTSTALATGVTGLAVSDTGQATTPYTAPAANTTCDIFSGGNVSGSVNGVINVATYGAECDARQGTDGSTTAGSTTFGSASAAFTSSDVGKIIDPSNSGVALGTTVVAILSSTSVQMSSAATATIAGTGFWTVGTDNTVAIDAALAAVPTGVTGGGAVYTPSVNPARTGWTGRCLIKNGVTVQHQGTFVTGDGPYVSIWQCSTSSTNDCVTIAGFTQTPTGVQNMGIIGDAGSSPQACLTLSGDSGIFIDRNWFQGCAVGLNVVNTTGYYIHDNVSELSQVNYEFSGTSAPGRILGNESYHNNQGGKGFYFNGVSGNKVLGDDNDDVGTTGNGPFIGTGLYIYNSSDLDLGTFIENYTSHVAGPVLIGGSSSRVRLRPVIHGNTGMWALEIDPGVSDVTLLDPDIDGSNVPVTTTLGASLSSSAATATVASTSGFPTSGNLTIDSEYLDYSGTTGTTFTGLTRGTSGTAAASHSSGAAVSSPFGKVQLPLGASNDSSLDVIATDVPGVNLVPGTLASFTTDSNETLTPGAGKFGDAALVYTGTGSAGPSTSASSQNITVAPGEVLTFGGFIDATNVTAGSPQWCLAVGAGGVLILCASATPGLKGRVATNYTVPAAGITSVRLATELNGATVASGKTLTFSSPTVLAGAYPQTYTGGGAVSCAGVVTLSGGAATFSNSCVSAASHCTANDQSAANPVQVAAPAAGSVALAGTGTDAVMVVCQ